MTERTGESSGGLVGMADTALDRRGFTSWPLRVRAAVAAVAVVGVAAGAGAFLAGNLSNAFGPDTVCGGMVNAAALNDALGSGAVSAKTSGDGLRSGNDHCTATVSHGVFGGDRSVIVQVKRADDLGPYLADSGASLFAASANGGASGAARSDRAWALLPGECGGGLRVEVSSVSGAQPGAGKLAGLAVSAANGFAADRGCGKTRLPAPQKLSEAGQEHELNSGSVCGLPGSTATGGAGDKRYRESVSTAFDPVWVCRITPDTEPGPRYTFLIGTEPRLRTPVNEKDAPPAFGRSRWAGSPIRDREVVATCQGRPTYFRMESGISLQGRFPDSEGTWKQFLAAGGKAIGCEPIL
ncbi:hypothetical protein [Streptomyces novaecaesareae]|uniref:hypothetical protein n=1 Tax=Streptomyces novaecaesareae TaxID=68244 RepID=UPI000AF52753|nr:hypothetical protein [Streptomyces novaecaesareae]